MSNCWLKKLFYTCNLYIALFLGLQTFTVCSQTELHFYAVLTEPSLSKKATNTSNLRQFALRLGTQIEVTYFTHPLAGKLAPLTWGEEAPFYSTTMRKYRDAFFNNSHKKRSNDFYFFVTADTSGSFFIPGKNIFFLAGKSSSNLGESMFRLYAESKGLGDSLTLDSLVSGLLRLDSAGGKKTYLFHDDVENLVSTNGLVAHAYWEKNPDGSLQLTKGLTLPYKRNSGKVNLAVDNYWIRPFYAKAARFIAPVHVALVSIALFVMLIFRKKTNERLDLVFTTEKRWKFRFLRLVLWANFFLIGYLVFWTTDSVYKSWFFNSTNYEKLGNISMDKFIQHLNSSNSVVDQPSNGLYWEVYIKERERWKMKRMKKVLYFKVVVDSSNKMRSLRFIGDSDELHWKNYQAQAQTHLLVYTYFNEQGNFVKTSVTNYSKEEIAKKFVQPDVGKRILVFVNGYRPVSTSASAIDAFTSIGNNGVEFPSSKNVCYVEDRFDYWRPWGAFDQQFIDRIKPNEVYYADGHHSVATSNYRSIMNFLQTSSAYPKPCKGRHRCEYIKTSAGQQRTLLNLPFKSNRKGFNLRRRNGKIAGMNLLQLLNEVPNYGRNDTLFFVAHSMGYAYALGMIDALGSSCQYKAFYILAPENAQAGQIKPTQWDEIYQYGCFAKGPLRQAACLQDGVAPQTGVKGLDSKNRLTFPISYERKMGFTGSHFVGYYHWIFDIPQGQKGAVKSY